MATARRMPQNIDTLDALTDKFVQNGNTTEIGGNVEVDGDLKVNGQIIGGGGGGGGDQYAKLIADGNVFKHSDTATSNITLSTPNDTTPMLTLGVDNASDIHTAGRAVTIAPNYIQIKGSSFDDSPRAVRIFMMPQGYARFTLFNDVNTTNIDLPTDITEANSIFATNNNLKTLFGNQSVFGTGNIDLYKHNITFISTEIFPAQGTGGVDAPAMEIYLTVYSSKNIAVDSLTDLKTLLGNTFKEAVSGCTRTSYTARYPAFYITETGVHNITGNERPYPAGTWTDTVTTI